MQLRFRLPMTAVIALLGGAAAWAAEKSSDPTVVWVEPETSIIWKTVTETPIPVSVDWPKGAVSAKVTAAFGSQVLASADLVDTSVSIQQLNVPLPTNETEERILDLTLNFFTADGVELSAERRLAHVGLVRGTGGSSFRCIPGGSTVGKWKSVKNGSAVVPVPEGTTSLTVDGGVVGSLAAPGWTMLAGLEPGTHVLSKSDEDGGTMDVPLLVYGGFVLLVR